MNIKMNWAFLPLLRNLNDIPNISDNYSGNYDVDKLPMNSEDIYDDFLYNLLNELHFVIGFQRIIEDNNNQINDNKKIIDKLIETDTYHSDLMYLKKVFFSEVKGRLDNIENKFNHEIDILVEKFNRYYHNLSYNLEITFEYLLNLLWEFRYKYSFKYPNENIYAIINALQKIGEQLNHKNSNSLKVADTFLKISFMFKDESLDEELQLYGLVFLIYFYSILCHDIPGHEAYSSIFDFIEYFDRITYIEQYRIQSDLLMCYQATGLEKQEFYSRINSFAKILRKETNIKKKYIEGGKCFATMNYNGDKFYSLSGSENFENYLSNQCKIIINSLHNANFKRIQLGSNTRYYYWSKYFIQYKDYKDYRDNGGEIYDGMNRLFSCCERKLLTQLYNQSEKYSFQMYIKYKPCKMCERAINDDKVKNMDYKIYYPTDNKTTSINNKSTDRFAISNFDKLAKIIRNYLK